MVYSSNNLKTPPGSSTPSFISCWDLLQRFSFCFPLCSDSRRSFRLVNFLTKQRPICLIFNKLQRHIVFLPFIRMLRKVDFASPQSEVRLIVYQQNHQTTHHINHNTWVIQGVIGTRNFYLKSEPGITIGIWQVTSSMKAYQLPIAISIISSNV